MSNYTKFFGQGAADLQRILKRSLLVRDIAVDLESCQPNDVAEAVRLQMKRSEFDIMGYRVGNMVTGYVRREDLKRGSCQAYQRKLEPCDKIGNFDTILDLLSRMKARRWHFVVAKDVVTHIVTLGDLQKSPVRMALFGLVSLLEIHLTSIIRKCYANDEKLQQGLEKNGSWAEASQNYNKMRRRKEQTDLASSLMLPAKYHLVCNIATVPEFLGFRNRDDAKDVFAQTVNLRNNLVHGHDLVEGTSWGKAIAVVENIRCLLDRYEKRRSEFEHQYGAVK